MDVNQNQTATQVDKISMSSIAKPTGKQEPELLVSPDTKVEVSPNFMPHGPQGHNENPTYYEMEDSLVVYSGDESLYMSEEFEEEEEVHEDPECKELFATLFKQAINVNEKRASDIFEDGSIFNYAFDQCISGDIFSSARFGITIPDLTNSSLPDLRFLIAIFPGPIPLYTRRRFVKFAKLYPDEREYLTKAVKLIMGQTPCKTDFTNHVTRFDGQADNHLIEVDKQLIINRSHFIDLEICLQELLFREFSEIPAKKILDHHVLKTLLKADDSKMFVVEVDPHRFYTTLYRLRKLLGDSKDYGFKQSILVAQDETETTGFLTKIFNWIKNFVNACKDKVLDVTNVVTSTFKRITEIFGTLFSTISGAYSSMVNKLKSLVLSLILGAVNPIEMLKKSIDPSVTVKILIFSTTIFLVLWIDLLRIFTMKILPKVRQFLFPSTNEAQAATELSSTVGLVCGIVGLTTMQTGSVEKKITLASRLFAVGSMTATGLGAAFCLLPETIKIAISKKFETKEQKYRRKANEWIEKADVVITLSATPRVLISSEFREWITELMGSAPEIMQKVPRDTQTQLVRRHVRIAQLYANLNAFANATSTRPLPYSVHIYGAPGVGKSAGLSYLVQRALGIRACDLYFLPMSSEYWDGWNSSKKVVVIDEFLIGDHATVAPKAKEYLALVGTNTFMPPLADTKNINVGIKGTTAEPVAVFTLNNRHTTPVNGFSSEAINRRRRLVIKMTVVRNSRYYNHVTRTPNVDKIIEDGLSIADMPWLEFDIQPAVLAEAQPLVQLTFPQLIDYMKEDYAQFKTHCNLFREALNETDLTAKDPNEMYDDVIRDLRGVPKHEQTFGEAFAHVFNEYREKARDWFFGEEKSEAQAGSTTDEEYQDATERLMDVKLAAIEMQALVNSNSKKRKKIKQQLQKLRTLVKWAYEHEGTPVVVGCKDYELPHINEIFHNCHVLMPEQEALLAELRTEFDKVTDVEEKPNCDLIANVDDSNVNPTTLHRHKCLSCDRGFPHKAGTRQFVLQCPTCLKNKTPLPQDEFMNQQRNTSGVQSRYLDLLCNENERITRDAGIFDFCISRFQIHYLMPMFAGPKFFLNSLKRKMDFHAGTRLTPDPTLGECRKEFSSWKIGAGLLSLWIVTRWIARRINDEEEIHSVAEEDTWYKVKQRNKPLNKGRVFARAQAGVSDLVLTVGTKHGKVIPVSTDTVMTFHHLFLNSDGTLVRDGTEMKLQVGQGQYSGIFSSLNLISDSDNDIAFIRLSMKGLPQFKSLKNRFWTRAEESQFCGCNATIVTDKVHTAFVTPKEKAVYWMMNATDGRRVRFEISNTLSYGIQTNKGDCGSIITGASHGLINRIMGFHVAGGTGAHNANGIGVAVTLEDIEEGLLALGGEVTAQSGVILPNARQILPVPFEERVHLHRKSKLQHSEIVPHLPWKPQKRMPILSADDPRADGDPVIAMVQETLSIADVEVDENCADEVFADMLSYYKSNLAPFKQRHLTFEEAITGLSGTLSSVKIHSSLGFPLCTIRDITSRKSLVWFEDGTLNYEPGFKQMVMERYEGLCRGQLEPNRFVAYLKDEPISERKEKEGRCRLVYCADFVSNVAFRMVFGSLLMTLNQSHHGTPLAIGMNQYSYDMEEIYLYLTQVGNNFYAGDLKNMDKRIPKYFLDKCFSLLMKLAGSLASAATKRAFVTHQRESPFQVLNMLISVVNTHYSGCFFTTPMNCFLLDAYMRYCFKKLAPTKVFEREVRMKILGDDHIMCMSDSVKSVYNSYTIGEVLECIGQEYTSDVKGQPLASEPRKFEELTFLGSTPRKVNGIWCGAFLQDSLKESICWTRNSNKTLREELAMAIELSSAHGEQFYIYYARAINKALIAVGQEPLPIVSWSQISLIVARRTAATNPDFPTFAQHGELVNLNKDRVVSNSAISPAQTLPTQRAMAVDPQNMDFGQVSNLLRTRVSWNFSDPVGNAIANFPIPFGVLNLGEGDNVQNMPFERFTYWRGTVVLTFQVNATRFVQGCLVAYFMPLAEYEAELPNITSMSHVFIDPNENSTAELRIPFRFPRTFMNTQAQDTETLGTVYLTPISALRSVEDLPVSITVFSRFEESEFRIPRPLPTQTVNRRRNFVRREMVNDVVVPTDEYAFEAQGGVQSSTISYNYSNVGGNMPVTTDTTMIPSQTVENTAEVDASAMPFDNPPFASGAVPIAPAFSGMANTLGVQHTVDLQLMPNAMQRQANLTTDGAETKIEFLLSRPCLLTTVFWSKNDTTDVELLKITLDSTLSVAEGNGIPINVAVLNQFMFFHADIEFTFMAVKTPFHTGRLQATMAYGARDTTAGSRNVSYSNVMNFGVEESTHKFLVEYNAQQEYLRTFEGDSPVDRLQNYSLGVLSLYVLNQMNAPETVADTVEVLVFARFVNARVAVPRPNPVFTFNSYLEDQRLIGQQVRFMSFTLPDAEILQVGATGFITLNVPRKLLMLEALQTLANGDYDFPIVQGKMTGNNIVPDFMEWTFTMSSLKVMDNRVVMNINKTPPATAGVVNSFAITGFRTMTPVFEAQSGDVVGVSIEEVEEQKPASATEGTTNVNWRPCMPKVGEKFEFCPSDIHELTRRYVRKRMITNPALDQFMVRTNVRGDNNWNVFNFGVQPETKWRALYSAWHGAVKFRIFAPKRETIAWEDEETRIVSTTPTRVVYVPYFNASDQRGYPVVDSMEGSLFLGETPIMQQITNVSSIAGDSAQEVFYPTAGADWIDVSAPFQSHLNFCLSSKTLGFLPVSGGTLSIMTQDDKAPLIFQKFADDCRLSIFRAPKVTTFKYTGLYSRGLGGFF